MENDREMERQMEYRRRKQLKKLQRNIFYAVLGMTLVLYGMRIRQLGVSLTKVQTTLKQIEALQQKAAENQTGSDAAEVFGEQWIGGQTADFISSIKSAHVERPIKRTREEAVRRLEELGQSNPVIAQIGQNSSLYPENMLTALANNPEMADFAAGYLEKDKVATGGLTEEEKRQDFPLFLQWDPRWGYASYGVDSNIGLSGCGPTCMTMAYLYYTGDLTMNPRKMAEYAQERGYHTEEGTSWSFWTDGAADIGLYGEQISLSENNMKAVLDCGGLLVCSMSPGDFTTKGHFILLRGYDEHGFFVHDPNRKENSKKQWEYDTLSTQIKNLWAIYDN